MTAPSSSLLREDARFRRYFLGAATSSVGDRITFVALPFAVLSISDSASSVAVVVAAQTLPFALLALLAGVVADRRDRRRIVLTSDLVRAATQATAAALLLAGAAEVWHLVVLAAIFGAADAYFLPATQGMLPQLVGTTRLQEAAALKGIVDSSSMVLGPVVAGLLIALLGVGGALAVDAATFLVSFACLAGVRPDPVRRAVREGPAQTLLDGLREGFAEVRARRWLTAGLAGLSAYTLIVLPAVFVLGPVLAEREYGGAQSWAVVSACFGLGSLAGNALALRWRPERPMVVVAGSLALASCQAAILGSGLPLGAIAGLEAVAGVGVALAFTIWDSSLQEQIPEDRLSRVTSYDFFLSIGLSAVGAAVAGPLAEEIGLQPVLLGMSVLGVPLALLLLTLPSVRALRRPRVAPGTSSPVPTTP